MKYVKLFFAVGVITFCSVALPQRAFAQGPAAHEDLQLRVEQLETQIEALRQELIKLRADLAPTGVASSSESTLSKTTATSSGPPQQPAAEKRLPGIDLGAVRATPYGTIYFNAFGNSGGTNNADVPLFATPTNQGNASMSVRQTRLGLKLEGPTIAHAKSSAQVEADFCGGFPAVAFGETLDGRQGWLAGSGARAGDWRFAYGNYISVLSPTNNRRGLAHSLFPNSHRIR